MMFGKFGQMMKIAGQMKTKWPETQQKLAEAEYTAEAGGGAVSATVSGKLNLKSVRIDPEVLADPEFQAETLEDMIVAAVEAAQELAAQATAEAMRELTGGMDLPGLTDLPM